jgi:hypothetical protein
MTFSRTRNQNPGKATLCLKRRSSADCAAEEIKTEINNMTIKPAPEVESSRAPRTGIAKDRSVETNSDIGTVIVSRAVIAMAASTAMNSDSDVLRRT